MGMDKVWYTYFWLRYNLIEFLRLFRFSDLPDTWRDLDEVAAAGASAIQAATGGKYTYGSSTNALYPAAGGSDDYAFAEADFPISFTMELPGGGSAGFDLPESQINAAVSEAWIGIKAMALKVNDKYA